MAQAMKDKRLPARTAMRHRLNTTNGGSPQPPGRAAFIAHSCCGVFYSRGIEKDRRSDQVGCSVSVGVRLGSPETWLCMSSLNTAPAANRLRIPACAAFAHSVESRHVSAPLSRRGGLFALRARV